MDCDISSVNFVAAKCWCTYVALRVSSSAGGAPGLIPATLWAGEAVSRARLLLRTMNSCRASLDPECPCVASEVELADGPGWKPLKPGMAAEADGNARLAACAAEDAGSFTGRGGAEGTPGDL